MRTRQTAFLGVIAALLTFVAGCGSESSPSATTPGSSGPTRLATPSHSGHTRTSPSPSVPHATEFNPPGDIPDNAVFVDHTAPGSRVHFTVPEGWAKSTTGGETTFTDKYNSISIVVVPAKHAPTEKTTRRRDVPQLRTSVSHFSLNSVGRVTTQHGAAVHLVYGLDSKPNPVTGKVVRDTAERFEFWRHGQEADLTLTGPVKADNVDPWRIVSDSLQWK